MSPMINPNAVGGAVPAMGNPQAPKTPSLTPQQIAALRKDPEVLQAVALFMGKPTPLDNLPPPALAELAGAVNKLGVQGAVAYLEKTIPPDLKQKIKTAQ